MLFHLVQMFSGAPTTLSVMKWIVPKHPVDNFTAVKNYQGMMHLNKKMYHTYSEQFWLYLK